jgi:hypothetical protein
MVVESVIEAAAAAVVVTAAVADARLGGVLVALVVPTVFEGSMPFFVGLSSLWATFVFVVLESSAGGRCSLMMKEMSFSAQSAQIFQSIQIRENQHCTVIFILSTNNTRNEPRPHGPVIWQPE